MNDMPDGGRMAPDAPRVSEPSRPAVPTMEVLFSPEFDKLAGALAKAQLSIDNPEKNREVEVYSKRTQTKYKFKFADYAAVMNAVRKPLAENGLVIVHLHRGKRLISMMLHASGQWMRSEVELIMESWDNQEFGSATSYMERYNVRSMCGLAAEEDDDGNIAAGNDWRDARDQRRNRPPPGEAPHPLLEHARQVKDLPGGRTLLELWLRQRAAVEKLRNDEAQAELWSSIVGEVAAALERAFGMTVAAAWKSWQLATTREHREATRTKWDGVWAETLDKFRAAEPVAYGDLVKHMNAAYDRIDAAQLDNAQREAGRRAEAGAAPGAGVPAEEPRRKQEEAPFGPYHVLDAQGDIASDAHRDATKWALDYEHIFRATPEGLRETLAEFNKEALDEAWDKHVGAGVILNDLYAEMSRTDGNDKSGNAAADSTATGAPAKEPAVPAAGDAPAPPERPSREALLAAAPPSRGGGVDMTGYLRNVGATLALVGDQADMVIWEELNAPVYMSDQIGQSTRLKVLKLAAGYKRALGIALPGAA